MGDSITAGFAMVGIPPEDLIENRDYVFSTGAADGAFTLANFLLKYNPDLQGASQSWTWPLTKGAWLDGGVSMAKVEDCPNQVNYLVNELKTTYSNTVNFNEDWKLLTLFIGANNLCGACEGRAESKPEYFKQHLDAVLAQIEQELPRTFVNLIPIFNISGVYYAGKTSDWCTIIHKIWKHECYCVETGTPSDLQIMDDYAVAYTQISYDLAAKYDAKNNTGFTVVVQPGLTGINLMNFPEPLDYLSDLDCFHPSLCANEAFAYQVWNNMMSPAGQKAVAPDIHNLKIKCPTKDTYIQ